TWGGDVKVISTHGSQVFLSGDTAWKLKRAVKFPYMDFSTPDRREALVKAVTDLGPGYWVVTPLTTDQGFTVLINRGFVPPERQKPSDRAAGQIEGPHTVVGLLRLSEPDGGFLRANDPAGDRWFSRDVTAIAKARGLSGPIASYFIDADATPNPGGWPRGGLTVVRFANSHLIYALTWFGLALMSAAGFVFFLREERKRRR
uniref:SURF1 family protein n=1 Tax=uncultured Brevundimonas sp. TaxID=213418 RepID=UPI0025DCF325